MTLSPAPAATRTATVAPGLVLAVILPASFMQLIDISIVNVAVVVMQQDLHASPAGISLVVAAYPLTLASTLVTGARLGDIYGYRNVLLVGIAAFTAASVGCAASLDPAMLIGWRLVQGAAAGLMYPQVMTIIQVMFTERARARAFGFHSATVSLALIIGPLVGGGLIALDPLHLGWRSIFYVNVPIGLASMAAIRLVLPDTRAPRRPRLDLGGSGLIVLALLAFVLPLSEGRQLGWPAWSVVLLAASVPLFAAFVAYERRLGRAGGSPVLRTHLLRQRRFSFGTGARMCYFLGLPAFSLLLTVYLQEGLGFSAVGAGIASLWTAIGEVLTSLLAHRVSHAIGHLALVIGCVLSLAGLAGTGLAVDADHGTSSLALVPGLFVLGLGVGLLLPSLTTFAVAAVGAADMASGSGMISTAQQIGATLGLAAIGIVFFSLLSGASGAAHAPANALRAQLVQRGLDPDRVGDDVARMTRCVAVALRAYGEAVACPADLPPPRDGPAAAKELHDVRVAGYRGRVAGYTTAFVRSLSYPLATFAVTLGLVVLARPRPAGRS